MLFLIYVNNLLLFYRIHVRGSDKNSNVHYDLEVYMKQVRTFYETVEQHGPVNKKFVFLATDEEKKLGEAIER